MKHLTPVLGLLLFVTAAPAQSPSHPDTSHRFLWFTGHWSATKKNTFIIGGIPANPGTPPPGDGNATPPPADPTPPPGTSITIGSDGSIQISGPAVDAWNKRLDQSLHSEQQFIQQLDNPQDNLEPTTHQLYQLLEPDAKQRQQDMQDLKIDPKQDILRPNTKPGQSPAPTLNQIAAQYCQQVKADYDEVISWWKLHAREKDASLTYPPPPAFEYDCFACDSNLRNTQKQTTDKYVEDFFKEEREHNKKALNIIRQMSLFGFDEKGVMNENTYDELFAWNRKNPSKSAPCSYMNLGDLSSAVVDITIHGYRRADKLMRDNSKNFRACAAIAKTWLSAAREVALIGGNDNGNLGMPELALIVSRGVEYYTDKFRHNDWRQIGNLTFILSMMRQQALLGSDNDPQVADYLNRMQRVWNGFKLSIEMDIKIGADGGYRIAHVKGEGHIIPAFQRDSNQCYKWVVADENSMDGLGFYKASATQTIDCNLLDNEFITPPQAPRITYVGSKSYKASLEGLSMDFCNPGHDTIFMTGFNPNPMSAGLWQIPSAGQVNLGMNGMEQFFEDANAKKKLVDDGEAQKGADQMQKQAEQLKAQMEALKSQTAGGQSGANYEKMMELVNKARSLSTAPAVGKILYLDFLLPVKNNDPVLVDKKFDAKEINPDQSPVIVYGYYTIHIENDGNGKTKQAPKTITP